VTALVYVLLSALVSASVSVDTSAREAARSYSYVLSFICSRISALVPTFDAAFGGWSSLSSGITVEDAFACGLTASTLTVALFTFFMAVFN
jgi:hypothetical protein